MATAPQTSASPDRSSHSIIEAWNTVLYDKFTRFRHLLVDGLAQHSDEALQRNPFPKGARVLDVGCGFGETTLQIARQVGTGGLACGVDCAPNFVRDAQQDGKRDGVENATFLAADAQWDRLGGPYDDAFARFGTMFFELPGAAMRNIRKSLIPGGGFIQIVWRKREDNPWLHVAELRVKEIIPIVKPEESGRLHCGPGPFSLAEPDLVSTLLKVAGFDRIVFERFDCDICIGRDLDDAVEFSMALGPAGEAMRLAGDEGIKRKARVVDALRDAFSAFRRADGSIWAPSSTWFVRARNPY